MPIVAAAMAEKLESSAAWCGIHVYTFLIVVVNEEQTTQIIATTTRPAPPPASSAVADDVQFSMIAE